MRTIERSPQRANSDSDEGLPPNPHPRRTTPVQMRGFAGAAEALPAVHVQHMRRLHAGEAGHPKAAAGVAVPGRRHETAAAAAAGMDAIP